MSKLQLIPLEERIVLDAAIAAAVAHPPANAPVIYVDANATGTVHDGTSWKTAYTSLQDGLAKAQSTVGGDVIKVADGTYTPGPNRTDTFLIPDQTSIYGGFGGTTILSGDIGVLGVSTDNSLNVVTIHGGTELLSGITVTGAYNNSTLAHGGGLYADGSANLTLDHMEFLHNYANASAGFDAGGGAVYVTGTSNLEVTNSLFDQNTTDRVGGAMFLGGFSNATISYSVFDSNHSALSAGALITSATNVVNIDHTSFTNNVVTSPLVGGHTAGALRNNSLVMNITNSLFSNNSSDTAGGALTSTAFNATTPTELHISNTTFIDNKTTSLTASNSAGGAILVNQVTNVGIPASTFTLDNSLFIHNGISSTLANSIGGAVALATNGNDTITDTLFLNNYSQGFGGAVAVARAATGSILGVPNLVMDNDTFTGNSANQGGAIFDNGAVLGSITNSMFKNNSATLGGGAILIDDLGTVDNLPLLKAQTLNLTNNMYLKNSATQGGAIDLNAPSNLTTVTVDKSNFVLNNASTQGGAIYQRGSSLTVTDSVFPNNSATLGNDVYVALPSTTNSETTPATITDALINANRALFDDEIIVA